MYACAAVAHTRTIRRRAPGHCQQPAFVVGTRTLRGRRAPGQPLPAASIRCRSHQSPCCASNTWRKYSASHTACARGCRHSRRRLPAREKAARFPAPHIGHLRRSPWQSSRQMHAHACGGGADTRAQEAEAEARTSWVPLRPWPRQRRRASSSTIGMSTIGAGRLLKTLNKQMHTSQCEDWCASVHTARARV